MLSSVIILVNYQYHLFLDLDMLSLHRPIKLSNLCIVEVPFAEG